MFGVFGAFDPGFYAKVAYQRVGRSIGFLAVFVLVISCVLSVKYTVVVLRALESARKWADTDFVSFAAELPELEIKDGVLIAPRQPYRKELAKGLCFAVEPDGSPGAQLLQEYDTFILLTQRHLTFHNRRSAGATEQKTYALSQIRYMRAVPVPSGFALTWEQNTVEVTPAMISRWITALSLFVFPFVFLFVFGIYSFTKPLQALFFSLAALIVNSAYKASLRYAQLFNISVYAMVPSTCAAVLLELAGVRLPFFFFLYTAFYVLFLSLGVQAARRAAA